VTRAPVGSTRRGLPIAGLVGAEFLSLLGNQIAAVAIPILVLQYTHSALTAAIAGIANVVPMVLAAFVGGRAIDRYGAWRLSVVPDVLSAVSVLALPLTFVLGGDVPAGSIFLLVFVGALFDPTGVAARQALVPGLARLARQPLERINTLRGGLENGADFVGPLLGVVLIASIGTANTLFVNAASFVLCAVIFVATVLHKRSRVTARGDTGFIVGARFILQQRELRTLAAVGALASVVLLPFLGLMLPVLATQVFYNPTLLGICLSAFGVSAMLGALAFASLCRCMSRSAIFYGGLLLSGCAIVLCGVASVQSGVVVCAALAGLLLGAGNPLEQTILQEVTPRAIAGQVFTAHSAIRFAAGPLGLLVAGITTDHAGPTTVLVTGGGLLAVAAVSGWLLAPLRDSRSSARRAEVT
jgi:predicted MFS family arabinose efflux permease